MHDALAVRGVKGVGHFTRNVQSFDDRQLYLAAQPLPERLAVDVLHGVPRERGVAVGREHARIAHWDDASVMHERRQPNLAGESVHADGSGQLGVQHLDRDRPIVAAIARQPDGGHPASAELALDLVAVRECRLQPVAHEGCRMGSRPPTPGGGADGVGWS